MKCSTVWILGDNFPKDKCYPLNRVFECASFFLSIFSVCSKLSWIINPNHSQIWAAENRTFDWNRKPSDNSSKLKSPFVIYFRLISSFSTLFFEIYFPYTILWLVYFDGFLCAIKWNTVVTININISTHAKRNDWH